MTLWQRERVKVLISRALKLPEHERYRLLRELEREDTVVREELLSLLSYGLGYPNDETGLIAGSSVGAYRISEILAEGGMGIVARAWHQQTDDVVALKVIRRDHLSTETLRRFHNERRLLAHIEHPNIVRLLDRGTTNDGRPFFAMELVVGADLYLYCSEHANDLRRRLGVFLQLCQAVAAIHRLKIVHRDLKPSNVLVTPQSTAKLIDFGVAKDLNGKTLTQTPDGAPLTPRYASPEQIDPKRRSHISPSSDVYSLGVILYQLLTGRLPFTSTPWIRHPICWSFRRPVAPSRLVLVAEHRSLARRLDPVVFKALRQNPRGRFPCAGSLGRAVRRCLLKGTRCC